MHAGTMAAVPFELEFRLSGCPYEAHACHRLSGLLFEILSFLSVGDIRDLFHDV